MLSMVSIAQLDQQPGEDATVDRVAAAAFEVFAEYGIRRATIEDVAAAPASRR